MAAEAAAEARRAGPVSPCATTPLVTSRTEAATGVAVGDPSRLGKQAYRVRGVAVTVVVVLVAAALWATALLVYDLIEGEGVSNSPTELLASGGRPLFALHHRECFELEIDVAVAGDVDDGFLDRAAREGIRRRSRIVV